MLQIGRGDYPELYNHLARKPEPLVPPRLGHLEEGSSQAPSKAARGTRQVYFAEQQEFIECTMYQRDVLQAGNVIVGPALVEEPATVTVVYPGDRLVVNPYGLLEIQICS